MQLRIRAPLALAWLLGVPAIAAAQSDVTFSVPVKLTQLSTEISQVQVDCAVDSPGVISVRPGARDASSTVRGYVNLPVAGGQVVTTATVVVPISADVLGGGATGRIVTPPKGTATYRCRLTGYSTRSKTWSAFSDSSTSAAFRLTPTPADLTGSFTW
jgi:hypothetical protein